MDKNFSVTQYAPEHRGACAELFRKVYGSPPFGFDWLGASKASMYFLDLENIPGAHSFILKDKDRIVGLCMGQKEEHFQTPGYKINEFCIDPEYQHMGLGSYLINEMENRLREGGIKSISLFTQRDMESFDFYRKNNFIQNDDTVHMVRIIQQEPTIIYTRTFLNSNG